MHFMRVNLFIQMDLQFLICLKVKRNQLTLLSHSSSYMPHEYTDYPDQRGNHKTGTKKDA